MYYIVENTCGVSSVFASSLMLEAGSLRGKESFESLWRGWFGTEMPKDDTYSVENHIATGNHKAEHRPTQGSTPLLHTAETICPSIYYLSAEETIIGMYVNSKLKIHKLILLL